MFKSFDLRQKKVIDIETAEKIGYIRDMDIDVSNGRINSVTIPQKGIFGFLTGKSLTLPWASILAVGSEYVLIKKDDAISQKKVTNNSNCDIMEK